MAKSRKKRKKKRTGGLDPKLWSNWLAYLKGGNPPAEPSVEAELARAFYRGERPQPPETGHPALVAAVHLLAEEGRRAGLAERSTYRDRLARLAEHPDRTVRRAAARALRDVSMAGRFRPLDSEHVGWWEGVMPSGGFFVHFIHAEDSEHDGLYKFVGDLPRGLVVTEYVPASRGNASRLYSRVMGALMAEASFPDWIVSAPITRRDAAWMFGLCQRLEALREARNLERRHYKYQVPPDAIRVLLGPMPTRAPLLSELDSVEPMGDSDLDEFVEHLSRWVSWLGYVALFTFELAQVVIEGTDSGLVVPNAQETGRRKLAEGMVRLFVDPDIRPLVLDIMALHAAAAKRVAGSDPLVAAYAKLWKRLSQGWLPSQDHLLWRLGTEIVSARVRRHYEQTREEEESGPSPDRLVWTVDEVLDAYARQETQEGESPGPESRVPDMSEPLIVPPR